MLHKLLDLCSRQDVKRLWALLALVIVTGLLEVAGIASILPFLQLASNPDAALQNRWLMPAFQALRIHDPNTMLAAAGWSVLVFLTVANLLSALAGWQRQRIAWTIAHEVSVRLASAYAHLPYRFFLDRDSGELIKSVIDDVNRLVEGVVLAGCQFVSQAIVAGMIFVLLAAVNPPIALAAFAVLAGIFILIFLARRRLLGDLGRAQLAANAGRYITFVDLMSGIKTVQTDGARAHFVQRFEQPSRVFADLQPRIHFSTIVPRYLVETVAFGAVIALVLFLTDSPASFQAALPMLTLFALAGYRLMPALNAAYVSLAQIAASYPAIESIHADIAGRAGPPAQRVAPLSFRESIQVDAVSFSYASAEHPVLTDVSLWIPRGARIALVGPSGSGKTTLVDIITGVLPPDAGQLRVDGTLIGPETVDAWQQAIGYVPQSVFLYNDSVANNIAFGARPVDLHRVRQVCRIAQIDDFIGTQMPQGYDTAIGEHGVRLSGGQRQRLGLARALYRQPRVLVLDEATSALDGATEGRVVAAIHDGLPGITIIMIAHRLSTVKRCDRLYLMDRGRIIDDGSYEDLLATSGAFRELV